jgi:Protein of unknown function (DUF3800)
MPYISEWEAFVHLAYLDESTHPGLIAIFGAVVIPSGEWGWMERLHCIAIEQLFAQDEIEENFKEFHAFELFKGEGAFKGISKEKRFDAIRVLLMTLEDRKLPYIYGAVDIKKLESDAISKGLFGTARPASAAFRLCALGVEDWARSQHRQFDDRVNVDYKDNYLFIVDDTTDAELKKQLRTSYKQLRISHPYTNTYPGPNRLWHSHDEMYFADSVSCLGVQIADLCTYFMHRHLLKRNKAVADEGDEFYEMLAAHAICARPQPEWSDYRPLLMCHDSEEQRSVVQSSHDANAKGKAAQ